MTPLRARLFGLIATLGLAVFVAGVPVLLLTIDPTPGPSDFAWSRLISRDDGTMAITIIGLVAWIAWVVFAVSVVLDVLARLRGVRAPRVPGLAVPQLAAGRLVGIAALLFVSVTAVGTVPAITSAPRAAAATAPVAPDHGSLATSDGALTGTPATASQATTSVIHHSEQRTEPYTVKRGDSLWKIAEERLGDGTRYVDLADLNYDVLGAHPDFLLPGTIIRVPVADPDHDATYIVQEGDTLSEIAENELDNAAEYPEIFDASRATIQPGGQRLTDPDLIRPGWHLTIPASVVPPAPPTTVPKQPRLPGSPAKPSASPPLSPSAEPAAGSAAPAYDTGTATAADDHVIPDWLLPGLAGAGAILAGSLLLVLGRRRHTQLRYRAPGRIIASPPPELRPVEKSIRAIGSVTAPKIDDLDRALRHLAAADGSTPRVVWAALTDEEILLRLAQPADLRQPWHGHGLEWWIEVAAIDRHDPDAIPPYPLLVSIGQTDDGRLMMFNLEEAASISVTGDREKAIALGRHIAAELALDPWSTLVEIDTFGIGDELVSIAPGRCRQHDSDIESGTLGQLAADLEDEDSVREPDRYRALITTVEGVDSGSVREVVEIVTGRHSRTGAAVVLIGGEPTSNSVDVHLDATGRLRIEQLGITLAAAGLNAEEACACAALVDLTREAADAPVPGATENAEVDLGGALAPAVTERRPAFGVAADRSLLPAATEAYVRSSATTQQDIEHLAPLAPPAATAEIDAIDPQLDDDLARWESPALVVATLTLLGPVGARGLGEIKEIAKRRPFYVELLAYLALHPHGATIDEIQDAFHLREARARTDLHYLRAWLGQDPHSHRPYFPNANQKHGNGPKGTYRLDGVLSDLDLFRRLRERGQRRGAAGITDLRAALRLVTGEPFSNLRDAGWAWLLDGERIDHIMSCAIADVAHVVTTHALHAGDIDLARFAAEAGYRGAPYDETIRLDLIAVADASGDDDQMRRALNETVLNRSDDDLGPIDLPPRTAAVLHQRGWTSTRARSTR